MRGHVPSKLSEEFLLVDLLHHLDRLPENKAAVLPKALRRAERMDRTRLARAVRDHGAGRAQRLLQPVLAERLGAGT